MDIILVLTCGAAVTLIVVSTIEAILKNHEDAELQDFLFGDYDEEDDEEEDEEDSWSWLPWR